MRKTEEGVVQRKTLLPVLREQKLMRSSIRSSGNQSIPAAPPIRFSGLEKRRPHLHFTLKFPRPPLAPNHHEAPYRETATVRVHAAPVLYLSETPPFFTPTTPPPHRQHRSTSFSYTFCLFTNGKNKSFLFSTGL